MLTKELWKGLTTAQRQEKLTEALSDLCAIDEGRHELSSKPEQGKLTQIKREIELWLLQVIEWEKPVYEENRSSIK